MKTNPKENIFLANGTKCNFEFKYGQTRPGLHRSIFFRILTDPDPALFVSVAFKMLTKNKFFCLLPVPYFLKVPYISISLHR
jgi:hypothetical protein